MKGSQIMFLQALSNKIISLASYTSYLMNVVDFLAATSPCFASSEPHVVYQ